MESQALKMKIFVIKQNSVSFAIHETTLFILKQNYQRKWRGCISWHLAGNLNSAICLFFLIFFTIVISMWHIMGSALLFFIRWVLDECSTTYKWDHVSLVLSISSHWFFHSFVHSCIYSFIKQVIPECLLCASHKILC